MHEVHQVLEAYIIKGPGFPTHKVHQVPYRINERKA